jgi:hypothetical protein
LIQINARTRNRADELRMKKLTMMERMFAALSARTGYSVAELKSAVAQGIACSEARSIRTQSLVRN